MKRKTLVLSFLAGALSLSAVFALAVDREQIHMKHQERMQSQANERIDLLLSGELLAREGGMGPGGEMGPGGDRGPGGGMGHRGDRGPDGGKGPGSDSDRGKSGNRGPDGSGMGPKGDRGSDSGMGSGAYRGY
ncbi:MAG: hypothetical protein H0V39_04085 [Nitrosomonas sp.]|nr:hypothetical protein [Nitrosomonas sp.]